MINKLNIQKLGSLFNSNKDFSYVVINDFFESDVANYLSDHFPRMNEMPTLFKEPMSYKGQLSDIKKYWPKFNKHFNYLQSQKFRSLISKITGIPDLIQDDLLAGAGLHQSPKSGFLDIHVDANKHPFDKSLHRRINIIIYLNKNWKNKYGGAIELWKDKNLKPGQLIEKISPTFNRAVIFATTRKSWHGVEKINCPNSISRKSIALYYYTKDRPIDELYDDSSVIWHGKSLIKKILYPLLNFIIKILKPYARKFKRNVFDAAKK